MNGLTAVSLFAGIGGFDLALERAGVEVVAAVEIDPACRAVLRRQFPRAAIFEDVTEVTGDQLRAAGFVPGRGIITGGWPCQGNSVAGRRGGMADPRSGLWRHIVRLVAETRPRWFLGENVPGLLSINEGRDFGTVISDLADLGYGVAWRVLDAQFFGVPQRRRRVFVAGCLGDPCRPVQVLLEPESGEGNPAASRAPRPGTAGASGPSAVSALQGGGRRGHRIDAEGAAGGQLIPAIALPLVSGGNDRHDESQMTYITHALTAREGKGADSDATSGFVAIPVAWRGRGMEAGEENIANAIRSGGDGHTGDQMGYVMASTAVRRLTPLECERLQGFPDGWTLLQADGTRQSDSTRYRQLGNSVAVPCVEWITRRIADADFGLAATPAPAVRDDRSGDNRPAVAPPQELDGQEALFELGADAA